MKIKKIIIPGLSLLFLSILAACGGSNNPTTTAPVQTTTTDPVTTTTADPTTTTTDPATTTTVVETKPSQLLKLTREFDERSNFVDDGIGYATLTAATDGDTATFSLSTESSAGVKTVRIRFQDIDTPESTGVVEKWGKAASKFTKGKLESATSIVLEAANAGEKDSYGERYLGWVWYKTDSMTDYVNLNLEVVENGYSESKANNGYKYDLSFTNAQKYAKDHNLHIWSSDDDPDYNDDPVEITIAELLEDLKSSKPTYLGIKVTFTAYIKSVTRSNSGTFTYVGEYLNDDNTTSSINLYAGYASDTINSYLRIGSEYHVVGTVQEYYGNYQVAIGGTYVALTTGPKYTYRLEKDYYMVFDSNHSYLYTNSETGVRSNATVTAVKEEDGNLVITANVFKKSKSETTETESFTFVVPKPTSYDKMVVGATFSVRGYQLEKGVITILSYKDISFK